MRSISRVSPIILFALAGSASAQAFPMIVNLSSLDGTTGFVINGIDAGDLSGISVSGAGDVNGDGIDDLVIGAKDADPNGITGAGESYVVFGRSTGFGASLDLSSLDGTTGFVLNGNNAGDLSGTSVSSAGDVNGDGLDDLVIGANFADPNGKASAGESYVVFGRSTGFGASLDLSSLDGTTGFVLNGINVGDLSGTSVSSAGDVNGDGIDDLIIGAFRADPNGIMGAGESYVVFGRSTGFAASLDLSSLDGTTGFAINGVSLFDGSGRAVSSAGDVNADGIDDLIIGAPSATVNGISDAGESYVVFGRSTGFAASLDLSSLDGTTGYVINNSGMYGDMVGRSVSSAGDINGDGFDDLIIGAPDANRNGQYDEDVGKSYVVFGGTTGSSLSFELSSLDGTNGFEAVGIAIQDFSGLSVSGAGDVNGDGFDDLIIGAFAADPYGMFNSGQCYVLYGQSSGFSASLDLSVLNGSNGFFLNGTNANDYAGFSVSSAGDINGDGIDDLIIGAYRADPNGVSDAGKSYVVFGRSATSPCPADTNNDGILTPADFTAWVAAFNTNAPECDQNGDGNCDPSDFTAWVANFNAGCP